VTSFLSAVGSSGAQRSTRKAELVFGDFSCNVNLDQSFGAGSIFVTFDGTAGITDNGIEFFVDLFPDGDAAALCEGVTASSATSAQELGCTTSPVRIDSNEFSTSRHFQFVCDGSRDRVVDAMGELARRALAASSGLLSCLRGRVPRG